MMGIKSYQEKMFYHFSLSQKVPADHLLRHIHEQIDVSFVRDLVMDKYSHTGQPSIDPEVLFKMMLLGYLYGITSERRLAQDVSLNLAYRWYLGYDLDEETPDHSVISKARARYGKEIFESFFQRILGLCVQAGLVRGEKVFADSTIIKANASLQSMRDRPEAVTPPLSPQEFIHQVFTENPVPEETKEAAGSEPPPVSNKTHVSKTDPDASLTRRPGKLLAQLAYKEHFTVDGHARVITAVAVTSAAVGDEAMLRSLLDNQPVPVLEVGADSKYGTFDNYHYLIQQGIRPSIPPWHPENPSRAGLFAQSAFPYNPLTDTYECPGGKILKRGNDQLHLDRWTFHARKRDCSSCLLRPRCIGPTLMKRRIFRHRYQEAKDIAMAYLRTEQGRTTQRQRKVYAEWINAESKGCHGLRRAQCRGLGKVTIQVLLTATVQNMKRLLRKAMKPAVSLRIRVHPNGNSITDGFLRPGFLFA